MLLTLPKIDSNSTGPNGFKDFLYTQRKSKGQSLNFYGKNNSDKSEPYLHNVFQAITHNTSFFV